MIGGVIIAYAIIGLVSVFFITLLSQMSRNLEPPKPMSFQGLPQGVLLVTERAFEHICRTYNGNPPQPVNFEYRCEDWRDQHAIEVTLANGARHKWVISRDEVRQWREYQRYRGPTAWIDDMRSLWWRVVENEQIRAQGRAARQVVRDARMRREDPARVAALAREAEELIRHISEHHSYRYDEAFRNTLIFGDAIGPTRYSFADDVVSVLPVPDTMAEVASLTQEMERQINEAFVGPVTSTNAAPPQNTLTIETMRDAMERLPSAAREHRYREMYLGGFPQRPLRPHDDMVDAVRFSYAADPEMWATGPGSIGPDPALRRRQEEETRRLCEERQKAEGKGLALLKRWLSPEQLAKYETDHNFEVTGSNGTRFRINHGRQQNVYELGADGNTVQGWCFLPEGNLVAGDCMLAQKIALETDEAKALAKANAFWTRGGGGRGGGQLWAVAGSGGAGHMYSDELSAVLLQQVQPLTSFCEGTGGCGAGIMSAASGAGGGGGVGGASRYNGITIRETGCLPPATFVMVPSPQS